MYEELINSLRICGDWTEQVRLVGRDCCDGCKYQKDGVCESFKGNKELLLIEAADAIEELQGWNNTLSESVAMLTKQIAELSKLHETQKKNLSVLTDAYMKSWIPVTERLPEKDGWYQVYAPYYSGGSSSGLKNINGNMYSAFKHGKWSIEVGYHKRPGCVKAWMPLPEPPKEV